MTLSCPVISTEPTQKPICSTAPQEREHEEWLAWPSFQWDCKGTQPPGLIFTHTKKKVRYGSRRGGDNNGTTREEGARRWDGIKQKEKKQPGVCYYTQKHVRDMGY